MRKRSFVLCQTKTQRKENLRTWSHLTFVLKLFCFQMRLNVSYSVRWQLIIKQWLRFFSLIQQKSLNRETYWHTLSIFKCCISNFGRKKIFSSIVKYTFCVRISLTQRLRNLVHSFACFCYGYIDQALHDRLLCSVLLVVGNVALCLFYRWDRRSSGTEPAPV